MTDLTYHLLRLTVLFLAAGSVLILLKKAEPSWRVALIRGVFVGAVILFFASFTGVRWEIPCWEAMGVAGDAPGESNDREIETVVVHTMDPAHPVAVAPPFERSGRIVLGLWIGGGGPAVDQAGDYPRSRVANCPGRTGCSGGSDVPVARGLCGIRRPRERNQGGRRLRFTLSHHAFYIIIIKI